VVESASARNSALPCGHRGDFGAGEIPRAFFGVGGVKVSAGSELTHYARHARLLHWQTVYWRAAGGLLIVLGLFRWGAAIGALPAMGAGFQDLTGPWQWATINLGVAYLVAGVGLWLLASWGLVVWFYGAACEIAMHTLLAGTFGARLYPVALQLALIGGHVWLRRAIHNASHNRFKSRNAVLTAAGNGLAVGIGRLKAGARQTLVDTLVRIRSSEKEKKESPAISSK
jgi:hypothetical protein